MGTNHNKKRNVGLMYELLLRHVSLSLIEENQQAAQVALDILSKRFDKNTELYKEFRLFNAIAKSTVSNTASAAAILSESKTASRRFDMKKLEKEKSLLIREVNHLVSCDKFYHRRIPDYKVYASIQILINEWQKGDKSNLTELVKLEGKIVEWLVSEKNKNTVVEKDTSVDNLVVKILTEKFNNRYGSLLSNEQKTIIQKYIFSQSSEEPTDMIDHLVMIKESTLKDLDSFTAACDNKVLLEKISTVKNRLASLSCSEISDENIKRFLTVSQLKTEILSYSEV